MAAGPHLSAQGVRLAREVGEQLGSIACVLTSDSPCFGRLDIGVVMQAVIVGMGRRERPGPGMVGRGRTRAAE